MNSRLAISLSLGALLVLPGFWIWYSSSVQQPKMVQAVSKNTRIVLPKQKRQPVVAPLDFDWAELSENDLNRFADYFGNAKSPPGFRVDRVVRSGEPIIMDVHEARPGEFVCTKITPTIKTLDNGTNGVEFKLDCMSLMFNGGQQRRFAKFADAHFVRDRHLKSIVETTIEGTFAIGLSGQIMGQGEDVRIRASSDYQKHSGPLDKQIIRAFGLEEPREQSRPE